MMHMNRWKHAGALTGLRMFLALVMTIAMATSAQTSVKQVEIQVVDSSDGSPLPYASIKVGQKHFFHTDKDAFLNLTLSQWPAGIEVSYVGYTTRRLTLTGTERHIVCKLQNRNSLSTVYVSGERGPGSKTANRDFLNHENIVYGQQQSMARILSSISGMRILSTGALVEKPILEGMSGSRISIISNHAKLIGQQWGDDHAPELSIPSYAKVTVEKGAQSVKYGSNAIGGIIRVNTDLAPDTHGQVLGVHSSYATNEHGLETDAYWENSLNRHIRYRIASKYYRSGSYSTADYLLFNTGAHQINENIDLATHWGNVSTQVHLIYYDTEMGIFSGSHIGTKEDLLRRFEQGRPDPEEVGNFSFRISAPKQRVQHLTAQAKVIWKPDTGNQFSLTSTWQSDYRREYELRKGDYTKLPSFAFRLKSSDLLGEWTHILSDLGKVETGLSWISAKNISDNNTKAVPIIPNYSSTETGLYGLITLLPDHGKMTVEAGLRTDMKSLRAKGYDWTGAFYSGFKHFYSLSGSAGLKYDIHPSSTIRCNVGLAWRAPEVNELYSKGVHHGDAVYQEGNPNLHTEKAVKMTAGYHLHTSNVELSLHGFSHYIHGFIYSIPHYQTVDGKREPEVVEQLSGTFPKYYFTQSDGIFIGGDACLCFKLTKNLSYTITGEWMRARNLSLHTYFPQIPADRYRHSFEYHRPVHTKWQFALRATHQYVCRQHRFDPDMDLLPKTPPAYNLLEARCSATHICGRNAMTIYIEGTNLLNSLYKDYTNRLRYFAHDKGREITVGIKYTFRRQTK